MHDQYEHLMQKEPEIEFHDVAINALELSELMVFADKDGKFTKSFDVTLKGMEFLKEIWILSTVATYTSQNGEYPMLQIRLINEDGHILYFAPPYVIGHEREFYRRQWRVPPTIKSYDTVRLSFIIPDGVSLSISEITNKSNMFYTGRKSGIRFNAHSGFVGYAPADTAFSFQMAAEMGFNACITIPKFTKDGIGVCFHDDDSVRGLVCYDDGSEVEEGSADDIKISDFTYEELMKFDVGAKKSPIFKGTRIPTMEEFFRICAVTGMQPIFSVHPVPTKEQWLYVEKLLKKYNLLEHFWIKSARPEVQTITTQIFDDKIAGYIMLERMVDDWDPIERAALCGLDPKRHNVVVEFFNLALTEEKVKRALARGFRVSAAPTRGGFSGPGIQTLIDMGVTEFTTDHHCSFGLCW